MYIYIDGRTYSPGIIGDNSVYTLDDGVITCACCECGQIVEVAREHHPNNDNDNRYFWFCFDGDGGVVLGTRTPSLSQYDDFVCGSCGADNYTRCADCGTLENNDDILWLDNDEPVCESCADNYPCCESCGVLCSDTYYANDGTTAFCSLECANNAGYVMCESCGDLIRECDAYEYGGYYYCESCYDDFRPQSLIENYHSHNFTRFIRATNDYKTAFCGAGFELEVERHGNTYCDDGARLVCGLLNKGETYTQNERVYFEHDGSLNDGFEIISQPHDRASLAKLDIEGMCETLIKHGFRSHDTSTCGLHVHISRSYFETETALANMCAFYNDNFEFFYKLSRRKGNGTRWAKADGAPIKSGDIVGLYVEKMNCRDRYRAVNLCNTNTVEFRLARGTLNAETMRAWIDLHLTIAENANNIPFGCSDAAVWLNGIDDNTKRYIFERTNILIF